MSRATVQPEATSGESPRRRKVRIVRPTRISRTTMISVGLGLAAAALLPIVWLVSWEVEPEPFRGRSLMTVMLTWQCEAGHTFQAAGQIGPRKCFTCDRPSYPLARYLCPQHGVYDAQVRLRDVGEGVTDIDEVRLPGSAWVSPGSFLCPRCRRLLELTPRDPLEDSGKSKRRGGAMAP
jgi:hypothetical protein